MEQEFNEEETTSEEEKEDEELGVKGKIRQPYFDKDVMEMLLSQMTTKLDWINYLDVVTDVSQLEIPGTNKDATNAGISSEVEDDFKREMLFYCQAQHAAKEALEKLRNIGVPTQRPEDYFAEMVKSDTHMQKIRQKLVARKESMEKSEKAKKQRQFKKIGKKIQQEVLQKRQQEKKKMLNAVDQLKKGKKKRENGNNEDIFDVSATKTKGKQQQELSIRGMKRKFKDEKFGFGGKKRKIKKNDAESSKDMSSYKPHINGKLKNGNQNRNKKSSKGKRLGKSRRMKQVNTESLQSILTRRGPDVSGSYATEFILDGKAFNLNFYGYVLHLRGNITKQPLVSSSGDVLLWNGEIFGGRLKVDDFANDTEILMDKLLTCTCDEEIIDVFSSINGPRAFIYYQEKTKCLWYGRDSYGRRSLLSCFKENCFALSSVGRRNFDMDFKEVPAKSIYCMQLKDVQDKTMSDVIKVFPLSTLDHNTQFTTCIYEHRCLKPVDTLIKGNLFELLNLDEKNNIYTKNMKTAQQSFYHEQTNCDNDNFEQVLHENKLLSSADSSLLSTCGCWSKLSPDHLSSLELDEFLKHIDSKKCCLCNHEKETQFDQHNALNNSLKFVKYYSIKLLQNQFFEILLESVKTRVYNLPRDTLSVGQLHNMELNDGINKMHAYVGVLFSGGVDSVILASLADLCIPKHEPIDLINVAFQQQKSAAKQGVKKCDQKTNEIANFDVPDRVSGRLALRELPADRTWNFIEVDVTLDELQEKRKSRISDLVYPLDSVLDDSIGCALWFAARGLGKLYSNSPNSSLELIQECYKSPVKVLLCGMGADEQLGGYARHRTKYESSGWVGLTEEMHMEMERISSRNLGRDDRCISDHGREARFPFLDENVVSFLSNLPACIKCDPRLPRGYGEKILLREIAGRLGLHFCSSLPKRAIQFGSKIAKMEGSKEKGAERCERLK